MSRSWAKGSTTAWRRLRAQILQRDQFQCQIRLDGCAGLEKWSLTGPYQAEVHHTRGRATTGDDPRFLVASCRPCNRKVGDPATQRHDPQPRPVSRW